MNFGTRKDIQEWFAGKIGIPAQNISVAVTGGVPGYSMIWSYEPNAHTTKRIHSATLTQAGR